MDIDLWSLYSVIYDLHAQDYVFLESHQSTMSNDDFVARHMLSSTHYVLYFLDNTFPVFLISLDRSCSGLGDRHGIHIIHLLYNCTRATIQT
jgi:hypothetical protein